jgi:hypothetical protein
MRAGEFVAAAEMKPIAPGRANRWIHTLSRRAVKPLRSRACPPPFRRRALKFTMRGLQCGSAPAARIPSDCWDGASLSTSEVARALSLSVRGFTFADVNVIRGQPWCQTSGSLALRRIVSDFAVWAHCGVQPSRCCSDVGLKSAIIRAGFSA